MIQVGYEKLGTFNKLRKLVGMIICEVFSLHNPEEFEQRKQDELTQLILKLYTQILESFSSITKARVIFGSEELALSFDNLNVFNGFIPTIAEVQAKSKVLHEFSRHGPWKNKRILMLGVENSGKTSILRILSSDESIPSTSTTTFNVGHVSRGSMNFEIWDASGQDKYLWSQLASNCFRGLIFVLNGAVSTWELDTQKDAFDQFWSKNSQHFVNTPIIFLVNKTDQPNCLLAEDVKAKFNLGHLESTNHIHFVNCSAQYGGDTSGVESGIDRLIAHWDPSAASNYDPYNQYNQNYTIDAIDTNYNYDMGRGDEVDLLYQNVERTERIDTLLERDINYNISYQDERIESLTERVNLNDDI